MYTTNLTQKLYLDRIFTAGGKAISISAKQLSLY